MFNAMRFDDVQQTLDHFRRSMDQLFDSFSGVSRQRNGRNSEWTFSPAIETGWDDNALYLRAILPGVSEKDLNVSVRNNRLIIEGERKRPETQGKEGVRTLEYGKFFSAVTLPEGVDPDKIECTLHDGVLDVTVPVSEQMKPRQIPIRAGEERKALAA